jgi:hypothetical protein
VVLVLAGCSTLSAGYVTNKTFTPAHYDTYTVCTSGPNGTTRCYPHLRYTPDHYRLDLRNDKQETGWVLVTKADYDAHKVGDWYPKNSGKANARLLAGTTPSVPRSVATTAIERASFTAKWSAPASVGSARILGYEVVCTRMANGAASGT